MRNGAAAWHPRLLYNSLMPHVDKHPPGEFSWIELATTDQAAAKNFYSALFGWTPNDMPMGPDEYYTIFRLEGRDAAAGYTMRAEERSSGAPPHWNLYITVASADDAVAKAATLGGKTFGPAFDVFDAGRMGLIQDPTGAMFCVWQPKKNNGIGISADPGTFCWADLSTPDPARAKEFYSGLFGWRVFPGEKDPSGYLHIENGKDMIGGIPPAHHRAPNMPAYWMIYFAVSDVDATMAKAKSLGAKVFMEPMDIEDVGRMAILGDPQGAMFTIFTGSPRL